MSGPDPLDGVVARAALPDLTPGVVVACSGGPDSLALLAVAARAGLEPVAVHVDHGLRPTGSAEAGVVDRKSTRLNSSH